MAGHARLEAEVGGYIAEQRAAEAVAGLRDDLGGLLGLPADGIAFVESASAALTSLLRAWPLPAGSIVGVTPSEWGPNLASFRAFGLVPEALRVDSHGRLDLDSLARRLESGPPALVHLVHVAPHRPLVQPVVEAARLCRRFGVPLWVDSAQAVGHVETASAADAVYGTSRKWVCGPRGVGFLGIGERHWAGLRIEEDPSRGDSGSRVRHLESSEAHVAGRVGLAVAVRELVQAGPERVASRLAEIGLLSREVLGELDGWEVVDGTGQGAITSLAPTAGQDPVATRSNLYAHDGILTTVTPPWRVPGELAGPVLRVSPHVDSSREDLVRLARALQAS